MTHQLQAGESLNAETPVPTEGGAALKPCPFCGVNLVCSETLSTRSAKVFFHPATDGEGCVANSIGIWDRDTVRIEKWNTRAAPAVDQSRAGGGVAPDGTDWKTRAGEFADVAMRNGQALIAQETRVNRAVWLANELAQMLRAHEFMTEPLEADDNINRVDWEKEIAALSAQPAPAVGSGEPVKMILHCPACGVQHIDEPELPYIGDRIIETGDEEAAARIRAETWTNPPHRSHLCHGCGHIWRPADVPTEGVASIATKGKADSPVVHPSAREQGVTEFTFDFVRDLAERLIRDRDGPSAWASMNEEAQRYWIGRTQNAIQEARLAALSTTSRAGE